MGKLGKLGKQGKNKKKDRELYDQIIARVIFGYQISGNYRLIYYKLLEHCKIDVDKQNIVSWILKNELIPKKDISQGVCLFDFISITDLAFLLSLQNGSDKNIMFIKEYLEILMLNEEMLESYYSLYSKGGPQSALIVEKEHIAYKLMVEESMESMAPVLRSIEVFGKKNGPFTQEEFNRFWQFEVILLIKKVHDIYKDLPYIQPEGYNEDFENKIKEVCENCKIERPEGL